MSWVTDIAELFGTGSVPVIVAGSVLGLFELGERFASQRAKDALSKWLISFDVQKAKALPDGTQELFESIFGERHFSWKCFIRSAAFSLGAMVFVGILCLLIYPTQTLFQFTFNGIIIWIVLALWLPWSIIIDYINLFKTRVILHGLTRIRFGAGTMFVTIAILVIDYVFYIVIFSSGSLVTMMIYNFLRTALYWSDDLPELSYEAETVFGFVFSEPIPALSSNTAIFFWSGFAPSIWMWLYVAALFVTRGLLRSEKLVNWLRWALDVEKNPFRSIGAVAATLAFIASVAIILVPAEVSRISTAL